jgi:hypothetical protein
VATVPSRQALATPASDAEEVPEQRSERRRLARRGTRADVRRAGDTTSLDLGVRLLEVSEAGACIRLKEHVDVAEELHLILATPDGSQVYDGPATVRWWWPAIDGTLVVGVKVCRPLTVDEVLGLAEH